jgi:hypothetical protein
MGADEVRQALEIAARDMQRLERENRQLRCVCEVMDQHLRRLIALSLGGAAVLEYDEALDFRARELELPDG